MKILDIWDFDVAEKFMSAINGDFSGLSDHEVAQWQAFESGTHDEVRERYPGAGYHFAHREGGAGFGVCDISEELADLEILHVLILRKEL